MISTVLLEEDSRWTDCACAYAGLAPCHRSRLLVSLLIRLARCVQHYLWHPLHVLQSCYELAFTWRSFICGFGLCLHELTAVILLQHNKNRPGALSTESLVHSCCVPCHHIGTLLAINIPCHTIILANTAHTLCPACNYPAIPPFIPRRRYAFGGSVPEVCSMCCRYLTTSSMLSSGRAPA